MKTLLPFRFAWQCCWLFFTGCYSAQKNGHIGSSVLADVQSDSAARHEIP